MYIIIIMFSDKLNGMSPHIRNVTIIRTWGRELSKNAIGLAHVHTRPGG